MRFSDRSAHGRCLYPRPLHTSNVRFQVEAKRWAAGRVVGRKYELPTKQRPDGTVAGSSKSLASRFYQLKTGHCLTGQ